MLRATLIVVFLALPDLFGDCLAITSPHVPPSNRVCCSSGRRSSFSRDTEGPVRSSEPEHDGDSRCRCCGFVGRSSAVTDLLDLCNRIARTEFTVLLCGETGTGKDLLARCIHLHSQRSGSRLTPVLCAALPEALLESELFGHKRGSFTGAIADQTGLVARASGGTLFLDEIDALSPAMQAKLLRVVEEHRVQRVGGGHDVPVDFRLIASTNACLEDLVERGDFRSDLFYRLNVVRVQIPPLRERMEDIPEMASHFRDAFAREAGCPVVPFSPASMDWLTSREWPGNVRQLKHCVERGLVLADGAKRIEPKHLGHGSGDRTNGAAAGLNSVIARGWGLRELERHYIQAVLKHTDGHKGNAADLLGIDRRTLYRKLTLMEQADRET